MTSFFKPINHCYHRLHHHCHHHHHHHHHHHQQLHLNSISIHLLTLPSSGADPGFFFRRGYTRLLLYFNTNKPHSFFLQNTSCIRKPQVIWGGGEAPLHPPPRSAPGRSVHQDLPYKLLYYPFCPFYNFTDEGARYMHFKWNSLNNPLDLLLSR